MAFRNLSTSIVYKSRVYALLKLIYQSPDRALAQIYGSSQWESMVDRITTVL